MNSKFNSVDISDKEALKISKLKTIKSKKKVKPKKKEENLNVHINKYEKNNKADNPSNEKEFLGKENNIKDTQSKNDKKTFKESSHKTKSNLKKELLECRDESIKVYFKQEANKYKMFDNDFNYTRLNIPNKSSKNDNIEIININKSINNTIDSKSSVQTSDVLKSTKIVDNSKSNLQLYPQDTQHTNNTINCNTKKQLIQKQLYKSNGNEKNNVKITNNRNIIRRKKYKLYLNLITVNLIKEDFTKRNALKKNRISISDENKVIENKINEEVKFMTDLKEVDFNNNNQIECFSTLNISCNHNSMNINNTNNINKNTNYNNINTLNDINANFPRLSSENLNNDSDCFEMTGFRNNSFEIKNYKNNNVNNLNNKLINNTCNNPNDSNNTSEMDTIKVTAIDINMLLNKNHCINIAVTPTELTYNDNIKVNESTNKCKSEIIQEYVTMDKPIEIKNLSCNNNTSTRALIRASSAKFKLQFRDQRGYKRRIRVLSSSDYSDVEKEVKNNNLKEKRSLSEVSYLNENKFENVSSKNSESKENVSYEGNMENIFEERFNENDVCNGIYSNYVDAVGGGNQINLNFNNNFENNKNINMDINNYNDVYGSIESNVDDNNDNNSDNIDDINKVENESDNSTDTVTNEDTLAIHENESDNSTDTVTNEDTLAIHENKNDSTTQNNNNNDSDSTTQNNNNNDSDSTTQNTQNTYFNHEKRMRKPMSMTKASIKPIMAMYKKNENSKEETKRYEKGRKSGIKTPKTAIQEAAEEDEDPVYQQLLNNTLDFDQVRFDNKNKVVEMPIKEKFLECMVKEENLNDDTKYKLKEMTSETEECVLRHENLCSEPDEEIKDPQTNEKLKLPRKATSSFIKKLNFFQKSKMNNEENAATLRQIEREEYFENSSNDSDTLKDINSLQSDSTIKVDDEQNTTPQQSLTLLEDNSQKSMLTTQNKVNHKPPTYPHNIETVEKKIKQKTPPNKKQETSRKMHNTTKEISSYNYIPEQETSTNIYIPKRETRSNNSTKKKEDTLKQKNLKPKIQKKEVLSPKINAQDLNENDKASWSARTTEIKLDLLKEEQRLNDLNDHVKEFLNNKRIEKTRTDSNSESDSSFMKLEEMREENIEKMREEMREEKIEKMREEKREEKLEEMRGEKIEKMREEKREEKLEKMRKEKIEKMRVEKLEKMIEEKIENMREEKIEKMREEKREEKFEKMRKEKREENMEKIREENKEKMREEKREEKIKDKREETIEKTIEDYIKKEIKEKREKKGLGEKVVSRVNRAELKQPLARNRMVTSHKSEQATEEKPPIMVILIGILSVVAVLLCSLEMLFPTSTPPKKDFWDLFLSS